MEQNGFYTNSSEVKFIDKLKHNIDLCKEFSFSVSFIKKPGLRLLAPNLEAALSRGAKGRLITSTYQNFTDVDSLLYFLDLSIRFPGQFECHLDKECFHDINGNATGFHSKGYLFSFEDFNELIVGSSNITVYALLKNVEWDVSVVDREDETTFEVANKEFDNLWKSTIPLSRDLIEEYKTHLFYAIERWDMDYSIANAESRPNYMQRRALKELNRFRVMGATRALVVAAAGSGKTYLAAFDAQNFNPSRLLYIAQEGSILMKAYETFQRVFGADRSYGLYNQDYKELDADFVFSTNITMANSLELFDPHAFTYCIVDECHHATATTYRKIIEYFQPEFLLGITATPERMDGDDVFDLFDQNVPYELRLRDAIVNRLVVPFHYYGIRDELIEYGAKETKGYRFVEQYSDPKHCEYISKMIEKYRPQGQKLKALAFCRDVSHAIRMSQAMEDYYDTRYLTGRNGIGERVRAYKDLQDDQASLEVLFTVDILNEGVDVPGVNMVLFLRPTDSQTIFIQQLGRGLRLCEGKEYVTVLDFIGNDYKRSVQIAFALGSLSENFVIEKKLIASLVAEDFRSLSLEEYGVEIHLDDLSKKEVLSFIDEVNFNTKEYLQQDYQNFKKYIGSASYPQHVDYLNNDYAPDLIKFMQAPISDGHTKTVSYYKFLRAIGEIDIPVFDERQEELVKYISEMLPIVRPYEYQILQSILWAAGSDKVETIRKKLQDEVVTFNEDVFQHALCYMCRSGYLEELEETIWLKDVTLNVELEEYLNDLLNYGLGKYDVDFCDADPKSLFHLWAKYRKGQVQQLLLKDPDDIAKGTKIYDGVVYIFATIVKANKTKEDLKYVEGYLDRMTFQWETVAHIKDKELTKLKEVQNAEVFVRKVDRENGIQLPFTYIGHGTMEYIENSKKANGAHLFRISMSTRAPEDLFFDFKLPG